MSLLTELKRRNVVRVATGYLAAAWFLIEVAGTVFPAFGFPDWSIRLLVIACALGFPPALIVSWLYEFTPEGIVRNTSVGSSSARRLDLFTACMLVAVLSFIVADHFWFSAESVGQAATSTAAVDEAVQTQYPANSIVVLPFVNMSDDEANEYFSDGISEELLNLLARIRELRVISRSSAFSFKGKEIDIPTVAKQLNVAHVLEGSVRKSGGQVRITVQLIDARSDSHLWSATYDRMLDDIFTIQDEIAMIVVEQLKVRLLGEVPTSEETNPEAYNLYLQARHLGRKYSSDGFAQSNSLYEQALAIYPDYAAAWSGLATNFTNQAANGQLNADEGYTRARAAAQKALEIKPDYAPAHANLGWLAYGYDNDMAQAAEHFETALKLDPANAYIIRSAAALLNSLKRHDEAIVLGEYITGRDPLTASGYTNLGSSYLYAGRWNEAIASYQTALQLSPDYIGARYRVGVALLFRGEAAAALDVFVQEIDDEYKVKGAALALHALGRLGESRSKLTELIERWGADWPSEAAQVYAYTGDTDAAFQWLDKAIEKNEEGLSEQILLPFYQPIQSDPRWVKFLERMGCSPEQLNAIEFKVTLPEPDN